MILKRRHAVFGRFIPYSSESVLLCQCPAISFIYSLARCLNISYFRALFEQVEEPHKAEIVTSLKGTVIRCAEESADMYKSIDEVCDRLVSATILFMH